MLRGDARSELFRRIGLFGGAAILGLWSADWIHNLAHPDAKIGFASFGPLSWAFAAFGVYGAIVFHDRFLKAASIAFAAQNIAVAVPWVTPLPNVLIGVVAVLLIVAGARHRNRQALIVAVAVFVCALGLRFVVS